MYVSALAIAIGSNHSALFQYDATKNDSLGFKSSETFICINKESALQFAPDGKIYCTEFYNPQCDSLSIFHNCMVNPEVRDYE